MKEERIIRLRQLVKKLRQDKKSQKQQIDILCNDILSAHSDFISHLKSFQFAADFYENILGVTGTEQLAKNVGEYFTNNIDDIGAAVVFLNNGQPQIHFYATDPVLEDIPSQITPYISARLTQLVCQTHKICTADQLCEMGFFAGPAVLKKLSLAAVGLTKTGTANGMLIIYRTSEKPLSTAEMTRIGSIAPGLSTALRNLQSSEITAYPPIA